MANKAVEQKLKTVICPYLVTARYLQRGGQYRLYMAYTYLAEIFLLLVGFGFANPVVAYLGGGPGETQSGRGPAPSVATYLANTKLAFVSIAMLVLWGVVKAYISREDLAKKCTLIKSYCKQCLQMEHELRDVLPQAKPMRYLTPLHSKLSDLVDRNIAEGAITGHGIDARLSVEINDYYESLVSEFSTYWEDEPDDDRRKPARRE